MTEKRRYVLDASEATFVAENDKDALYALAEYFDDLAEGLEPRPIFQLGSLSLKRSRLDG